jgi:hypothetical protein
MGSSASARRQLPDQRSAAAPRAAEQIHKARADALTETAGRTAVVAPVTSNLRRAAAPSSVVLAVVEGVAPVCQALARQ